MTSLPLILFVIFSTTALIECSWSVDVGAGWSSRGGWSVNAGVSWTFRKKRSTTVEINRCLPTLPCDFGVYDKNKDSKISFEEFEKKLAVLHFTDERNTIFMALDADGDSNISKTEFTSGTAQITNSILFPDCQIVRKVPKQMINDLTPGRR